MKTPIRTPTLVFWLLVAVLTSRGVATFVNLRAVRHETEGVARAHETLGAIQACLTTLADAETGKRGFLLTQDTGFLEPFEAARKRAGEVFRRLGALAEAEPGQAQRARELEPLVAARLAELEAAVALARRDPGAARRLVQNGPGRATMSAIRGRLEAMAREERAILERRTFQAGRRYRGALVAGTLFALAGALLAVAYVMQLRRYLKARLAQARAREQNRQWLRVTLSSIGDAVITTDPAGAVTFLNPVAEALTGWNGGEALGQPLGTIFQVQAAGDDPVARILQGGPARQAVLVRRDGREIPVEASAAPIRDRAAESLGVVLVFRDVTDKRRADEALAQSEARFRTVLEHSRDALYCANVATGRFEYISPAVEQLTGHPAGALLAMSTQEVLEMVHPDDLPAMREALNSTEGDHIDLEYRLRTAAGDYRWMSNYVTVVRDPEGAPLHRYGILRDITERKRDEELQKKLNRTLRALSNSNQALMHSEHLEENAFLAEICDILARDCGYAMSWIGYREEDPARTIRPLVASGLEIGFLEGLGLTWSSSPRGRGPAGTAIRTGKPCLCRDTWTDPAFAPWREEARRLGYRAALALPLVSASACFGALVIYARETEAFENDEVALLEELAADLVRGIALGRLRAAKAQAEQALQAREAQYHSLFNSLMEGFCIIEVLFDGAEVPVDFRFVEVNPAFESQTGLREAKGRRMRELAPDHEAHWFEIYGHVARTGQAVHFVNEARSLGRWLDVRAYRLAGAEGGLVAVLCQDITAQKRAQEALREEARRKDAFLAALGHELRNPLAPIRNAVHLLGQSGGGPEVRATACAIVERQTAHMARLVDDLLDVARIARGQVELQKEPLDLVALVRGVLADYQPILARHGLTLETDLPGEPLWTQADPARIVQILSNLLHNAVKFTTRGGRVRVEAGRQEPEGVRVRVVDDGAGIAPEALSTLFDPYLHDRGAVGRSKGGLGLGLALARGLARLHGGGLEAHSDGPGRGAAFTLDLPDGRPGASEPAPPPVPAASTGSRRVLVVEDLPDAALTLKMVLELLGHRVAVAGDGRTALEMAEHFGPDVVLCDIGLPGDLDGYQVARLLRGDPRSRGLRLVAMTGFGTESDRSRALGAGFDDHLTKPVDPEALGPLIIRLTGPAAS